MSARADQLLHHLCYRASAPFPESGSLEERFWADAAWSEEFVDIEGDAKPAPRFRTRMKMLWDDACLYVGAEMEEPNVWATLTEHDSVIFHDNDFEVFIDPDGDNHDYYEIEINALNTTWDLQLVKPYRDGGPALNEWEIPGFRSAVHIDGTLNDPTDVDRGWSVAMAIPWEALGEFARCPAAPCGGDQWRINFSRVEWDVETAGGVTRKVPDRPEHNWVWSPQGAIDMHRPERWGVVQFETGAPGGGVYRPDPAGPAREALMVCYHLQRNYRARHGAWAGAAEL
ncbi:MAG TPA: carbohydrate-binding family 9-like protein, partial [Chthonomonadaceae bacterium]|nr:carbohydrate-binding family 9-like protein [Chthonomonadaceae bacterium]